MIRVQVPFLLKDQTRFDVIHGLAHLHVRTDFALQCSDERGFGFCCNNGCLNWLALTEAVESAYSLVEILERIGEAHKHRVMAVLPV